MMNSKKNFPKRKKGKRKLLPMGETLNASNDEELKYLEKIVLGTGSEIFDKSDSDSSDNEDSVKKKLCTSIEEKKPAWEDDDDNFTFDQAVSLQNRKINTGVTGNKKYQEVIKKQYQEVMGVPKWVETKVENLTPVDKFLSTCGNFIKKPDYLNKDSIVMKKLKNLNIETNIEGSFIHLLKFHPKSTVAMIGGSSGVVSIVQVDGKVNTKLHSIQFKRFPISCGSILRSGNELLIGSPVNKFFYSHDLISGKSMRVDNNKAVELNNTKIFCVSPKDDVIAVCGNTGTIILLTVNSKELIDTLQMNCNTTSLCFNNDGSILYSHGDDGEIYMWDMHSRRCIKKFYDDGCLKGTCVSASNNNQFIASGSSSGVVNVYNHDKVKSNDLVTPFKAFYNLVTPVTSVLFNSSSEVLAIASGYKETAVKLVHCPSMTVFSNFPDFKSKIKKPLCLDFSVNSGYFGVGDNNGAAHLFRLKHYGNY